MKVKEFYKSTAWLYFSKWVLLSNSQDGQHVRCKTCDRIMDLNSKTSCAGHWIKVFDSGSNTHFSTAFEEHNCWPQCYHCNKILNGRPDKMEFLIRNEFGDAEADRLITLKKQSLKLDKFSLDLIKDKYKTKFIDQVGIKGNPWK